MHSAKNSPKANDAKRVAILASGEGTTAETFIRAGVEGRIDSTVGLIICNNPNAGIFARIDRLNSELGLSIQCLLISNRDYPAEPDEDLQPGAQTKSEEHAVLSALTNEDFDAICLMGYMKRIGPSLIHEFGWRSDYSSPYQARMLNTHPGLLPETKGLYGIKVQQYVLQQKLPYSGQTLHTVSENYDEGMPIAEHRVKVLPDDTPESLFERVQAVEKKYLPLDIDAFIKNRQTYLMKGKK